MLRITFIKDNFGKLKISIILRLMFWGLEIVLQQQYLQFSLYCATKSKKKLISEDIRKFLKVTFKSKSECLSQLRGWETFKEIERERGVGCVSVWGCMRDKECVLCVFVRVCVKMSVHVCVCVCVCECVCCDVHVRPNISLDSLVSFDSFFLLNFNSSSFFKNFQA